MAPRFLPRPIAAMLCVLGLSAAARCEEAGRLARTPREVAEQLAKVYGHQLDQVAYIPALPLVAKLRLSELTHDAKYAGEVAKITSPFLRGEKSPVPKSGSEQAGHLVLRNWPPAARGAAASDGSRSARPLPTRSLMKTAGRGS